MTTLGELAAALGLTFSGPSDTPISGVKDVERLKPEDSLEDGSVYFIETPAVLKRHPKAAEKGVILTTPALAPQFPRCLIAKEGQSRWALIALLARFDKAPKFPAGVAAGAHVHPSARVDATASVQAGAVVMEGAEVGPHAVLYPGVVLEPRAKVGEGTVLFPNVVIGYGCSVGRFCSVHAGSVIGGEGFGFHDQDGKRSKVPQIGDVVLRDHVRVGASCTVDRGTIESTVIGEHTKLDDQVHIGHNCQLGRYIYVVGNSAVGGSCVIEDGSMISGMVIVKDHLHLAKGTIVMGLSGVAQDTEPGTAYFGSPARPARQMHKMNAALERLPELLTRVKELEAKLTTAP
ncbi:UDP-3-O-(3-hydroxymyristoyl)glucosamine N-acyltransferase [bacterium]|nr:MAG: UDP-3-O-(3-hydroxymyristoyl)glucosamine N-acyltransferase [bacterium]